MTSYAFFKLEPPVATVRLRPAGGRPAREIGLRVRRSTCAENRRPLVATGERF